MNDGSVIGSSNNISWIDCGWLVCWNQFDFSGIWYFCECKFKWWRNVDWNGNFDYFPILYFYLVMQLEYRDEYNLRCRVFGHSDKNLGKRTKILYPDDQPNDLWEYELHKCRRCGKENEGWYHHNITSQKRYERENWKINLF